MLKRFRPYYHKFGKDTRIVLGNFFSLSSLEIVNYALPLITFPYLVRVLGPANFGLVALAQACAMYFVWLVDYGFCLSAPRDVSILRERITRLSSVFSSIMSIKFILMILCAGIYIAVVMVIPKFRAHAMVFFFSYGYVVGDVLFPVWFFQGVEKMKYITYLYLFARVVFLIAVFLVIRKAEHYFYVPLLNTGGMILAGLLSLLIIHVYFRVRFKIPSRIHILEKLKDGWHFFVSSISMTLYTNSSPLILGLLVGEVYVGYFVAGEKFVRVIQRVIVAISRSAYPRINKLATESRQRAYRFLRWMFFIVGGVFFFASIILFIFAEPIIRIVLGQQYIASIPILRILAVLPFTIAIGNIFGLQTMPAFNMKEVFSRILFLSAIWHLIVCFVLVSLFKHIGAAITLTSTEILVTLASFYYLYRKNVRFWERPEVTR